MMHTKIRYRSRRIRRHASICSFRVREKRARLLRDAGEQILALIRVGYTALMYPGVFPGCQAASLVPSLRLSVRLSGLFRRFSSSAGRVITK